MGRTHELTDEQRTELERYIDKDGAGVVFCVALSMAHENGVVGMDAFNLACTLEKEYGTHE